MGRNNMKIKLVVLLSLLLMNFVPMNTNCAVAAQIPGFRTVLELATLYPPGTWNLQFPLSDQSNNSHWVPNLAFSDEFRSTTLNTQKWLNYDPNTGGGVDRALTVPTTTGIEFHIRKGPTQGTHVYRGSEIFSKNRVLYGYFEAKIKMPRNYANNNFFLYAIDTNPRQRTEIDITEQYPLPDGSSNIDAMVAHIFYSPTISKHVSAVSRFRLDRQRFSDDYHVFGLAWTKNKLSWYLDGHLLFEGVNSSWHQPLNIILGVWDRHANDQLAPALVPLEAMKVKYLHVWK
jgi:beta-glucanase (GH16 family)